MGVTTQVFLEKYVFLNLKARCEAFLCPFLLFAFSVRIGEMPSLVFLAFCLAASLTIGESCSGLGAGLFFFKRPVFLNTTAEASPFTNVTIDTTNTNNPQITQSQTATQTLTNTNNDQDQNTSDSNNQITNTGNTVTVNNNGRRKRSLKELLGLYLDKSSVDEKFMERFMKKHEDLLDDVLMVPDGG